MFKKKQKKDKKRRGDNVKIKKIATFFINYFKWALVFLFFLIFTLGYLFIIEPKYDQVIKNVQLASAEQEEEFSVRERYLIRLVNMQKDYNNISQADINKINLFLPNQKEIEDFMVQLEEIVKNNGLLLTFIGTSAGTSDKKKNINNKQSQVMGIRGDLLPQEINKINIDMGVVGVDYIGLKSLLKVIETNLRLTDIESVSFSPDENSVILVMSTYFIN